MVHLLAAILTGCFTITGLADQFFPVGKENHLSETESVWYSDVLSRLKEPNLLKEAQRTRADVYRLLILPTRGNAISIRLERKSMAYVLEARRLGGEAGFKPGKLVESTKVTLTQTEACELSALLKNLNVFSMPFDDQTRFADGDEWVLEAVSNTKAYHLVQRCCVSNETGARGLDSFLELCKFLLKRSNLSQGAQDSGHDLIMK